MLQEISYYSILGKPLFVYLGIAALLLLVIAAVIGYAVMKGKAKVDLKWHFRLAGLGIALAAIHGILVFIAPL